MLIVNVYVHPLKSLMKALWHPAHRYSSSAALNLTLRKTAGLHLQFGSLLAGVLLIAAVFAS